MPIPIVHAPSVRSSVLRSLAFVLEKEVVGEASGGQCEVRADHGQLLERKIGISWMSARRTAESMKEGLQLELLQTIMGSHPAGLAQHNLGAHIDILCLHWILKKDIHPRPYRELVVINGLKVDLYPAIRNAEHHCQSCREDLGRHYTQTASRT